METIKLTGEQVRQTVLLSEPEQTNVTDAVAAFASRGVGESSLWRYIRDGLEYRPNAAVKVVFAQAVAVGVLDKADHEGGVFL